MSSLITMTLSTLAAGFSLKKALLYSGMVGGVLFVGTVALQHIANVNQWRTRPSDWITTAATWSQNKFWQFGKFICWLCSFLFYLHLEGLPKAIFDVTEPGLKLLFSWWWTIKGYVETSITYSHPGAIYIGGGIIIAVIGGIIHWRFHPFAYAYNYCSALVTRLTGN